MVHFSKYHGAGNDFVLIDNRLQRFNADNSALIAHMCSRRFGIGADGLMLLQNHAGYHFQMLFYNADGYPGSMCGNGARCIVAFAHHLNIFRQSARFLAPDGEHTATMQQNALISLQMNNVAPPVPHPHGIYLYTGSPHLVIRQQNVASINVAALGRKIRYSQHYQLQGGTNVNYYYPLPSGQLQIRTYERGVEDETYACGTGAVATAIAHTYVNNPHPGPKTVNLNAKGGRLTVTFNLQPGGACTGVVLTGPAVYVFTGTIAAG